jgi:hypothetical protein
MRGIDARNTGVYGRSCPPDLNGDGAVNTQDFVLFLNLWAGSGAQADWNADGVIDTRDFLAYLTEWSGAYQHGGRCDKDKHPRSEVCSNGRAPAAGMRSR